MSDPLSFTFLPGVTYAVGATASVTTGYYVAFDAASQNGITVQAGNDNVSGTTISQTQQCCSTGLVFYGPVNPTPEPASLAVMALPLGLLSLRRRRKRA